MPKSKKPTKRKRIKDADFAYEAREKAREKSRKAKQKK